MHYSRCRAQEIKFIKSIVDKFKNKPIVMLGDFNFDLNLSEVQEWPEFNILNQLNFNDSWIISNPNTNYKCGLTENTELNSMRYNNKFEDKLLRYDGILFNNKLDVIESNVVCNRPLRLYKNYKIITDIPDYEYQQFNRYYKEAILPKKIPEDKQPILYSINGEQIFDLFISDHFGICSKFEIKK